MNPMKQNWAKHRKTDNLEDLAIWKELIGNI